MRLDAGEEDDFSQLVLDLGDRYVLRVVCDEKQAWCRFLPPIWMMEFSPGKQNDGEYLRLMRKLLDQLAQWLEIHAQAFLREPGLESWVSSLKELDALDPLIDVRSLTNAIAAENHAEDSQSTDAADLYSRLLDHLLLIWPGRTCVSLKDILQSERFKVSIAVADILPKACNNPEKWLSMTAFQTDIKRSETSDKSRNTESSILFWSRKARIRPDLILQSLQVELRKVLNNA